MDKDKIGEEEVACYLCKKKFKRKDMQNYFGALYCLPCWKIVHPRKDKDLIDIGKKLGI
jgi:hypothetical protein